MASERQEATKQATDTTPAPVTGTGKVVGPRVKTDAEAAPSVWFSYILVYGTLGGYFAYRWRKLRQTEDRVRFLQKRLQEKYEADMKEYLRQQNEKTTK